MITGLESCGHCDLHENITELNLLRLRLLHLDPTADLRVRESRAVNDEQQMVKISVLKIQTRNSGI